MPAAMAQNMNTVSMGSFTAVRKRTMDSAPTMPRDSPMLEEMHMMIMAVTMVSMIREMLKLWL